MMGAGKSTVGDLLSARLDWPHVDNDTALEELSGLSRAELALLPVDRLHSLEAEHARRMCDADPPLIAGVAASVADDPAVMDLLASSGFCVYLALTAESALARVGKEGVGRQVLDGGGAATTLSERFSRRDPVFRSHAALVVGASRPPEESSDRIVDAWTAWSS